MTFHAELPRGDPSFAVGRVPKAKALQRTMSRSLCTRLIEIDSHPAQVFSTGSIGSEINLPHGIFKDLDYSGTNALSEERGVSQASHTYWKNF